MPYLHRLHNYAHANTEEYTTATDWFSSYKEKFKGDSPKFKALYNGFCSEQFAFTFLGGYQAAIENLFCTDGQKLSAVCVSEEKGGHPKYLSCLYQEGTINGEKHYVTAAPFVENLFIATVFPSDDSTKKNIKIVKKSLPSEAITIRSKTSLFLKEIGQGKAMIKDLKIKEDDILKGDGYIDYIKPFRTVEDIHINLSIHGSLLRQALLYKWENNILETFFSNIDALLHLSDKDPKNHHTHILLSSIENKFSKTLDPIEQNIRNRLATDRFIETWNENKTLLELAKKVKAKRTAKAWEILLNSFS